MYSIKAIILKKYKLSKEILYKLFIHFNYIKEINFKKFYGNDIIYSNKFCYNLSCIKFYV